MELYSAQIAAHNADKAKDFNEYAEDIETAVNI